MVFLSGYIRGSDVSDVDCELLGDTSLWNVGTTYTAYIPEDCIQHKIYQTDVVTL